MSISLMDSFVENCSHHAHLRPVDGAHRIYQSASNFLFQFFELCDEKPDRVGEFDVTFF